jgi:hypothetical protein
MLFMLFYGITVHEYIVQIYVYKSPDKISEDHCPMALKHCGGVTISLLHCMAHKSAIHYGKGDFPHITQFYAYLLICVRHVDLESIFSLSNIHPDLHHIVISFTTVNHSPQSARFLWHTEYRCCLRHICLFPPSSILVTLDLLSKLRLERIKAPWQVVIVLLILIYERNLMIHLSKWGEMWWCSREDVHCRFYPFLS